MKKYIFCFALIVSSVSVCKSQTYATPSLTLYERGTILSVPSSIPNALEDSQGTTTLVNEDYDAGQASHDNMVTDYNLIKSTDNDIVKVQLFCMPVGGILKVSLPWNCDGYVVQGSVFQKLTVSDLTIPMGSSGPLASAWSGGVYVYLRAKESGSGQITLMHEPYPGWGGQMDTGLVNVKRRAFETELLSSVETINDFMDGFQSALGTPTTADSSNRYIFSSYDKNGSAVEMNNWGGAFSGVAWDARQAGTLISDRHVVMAGHYERSTGSTIIFHDTNGNPVVRTIARFRALDLAQRWNTPGTPRNREWDGNSWIVSSEVGSWDLYVGILNSPVPSNVEIYRLADHSTRRPDARVITTHVRGDQSPLAPNTVTLPDYPTSVAYPNSEVARYLSISEWRGTGDQWVSFGWAPPEGWAHNFKAGDSGHPTFVVDEGYLVLVGTSTYASTSTGTIATGQFYGSNQVQKKILEFAHELDDYVDGL